MKALAFVDGTNLLTELIKTYSMPAKAEKPPDALLQCAAWIIHRMNQHTVYTPARVYWFGSYRGNEVDEHRIQDTLRGHRIEATLFRRREDREKGVDISLTKEMLVHAFQRNAERSYLFAGDEDYVPLVNETKRYGQEVHGCFFKRSTSPHLIRALDGFTDLEAFPLNYIEGKDAIQRCTESLKTNVIPQT